MRPRPGSGEDAIPPEVEAEGESWGRARRRPPPEAEAVYSIAYKCFKDKDKGICTLPHVIAFALSDSELVFEWYDEGSLQKARNQHFEYTRKEVCF